MPRMRTGGFTLVELMVVIAILAIVAAIAFPSFQATIRSNRLATATNELTASLALARAESLRTPAGASICTSSNGTACTDTPWHQGWIVWIDMKKDGVVNTGEGDYVVRYSGARKGLSATTVDLPTNRSIRFDNRGLVVGSARSIRIESSTCPSNAELVRVVQLRATGNVAVTRGKCT